MPKRKMPLVTGNVYHVFNRSIDHENILLDRSIIRRVLELIDYYRFPTVLSYSHLQQLPVDVRLDRLMFVKNSKPLVEIYAYALMPNHFHLLIKQNAYEGINRFMKNVQNSLAKYINLKKRRYGPLYTGRFKAVYVESGETFMHIARYIHLNPFTSSYASIDELKVSNLTSLSAYVGTQKNVFLTLNELNGYFKDKEEHWKFVVNQSDYQKKLSIIKHLATE